LIAAFEEPAMYSRRHLLAAAPSAALLSADPAFAASERLMIVRVSDKASVCDLALQAGETVRLRLANASPDRISSVSVPGLRLTVVAADGHRIEPVAVDALNVGGAETYDVLATARKAGAYPILVDKPCDGRTLAYADLRALIVGNAGAPDRRVEVSLASGMRRQLWSGPTGDYVDVRDDIAIDEDERVRLTLVNDTGVPQPLYLEGADFELVNGQGARQPKKRGVTVAPGDQAQIDIVARSLEPLTLRSLRLATHSALARPIRVRPADYSHPLEWG